MTIQNNNWVEKRKEKWKGNENTSTRLPSHQKGFKINLFKSINFSLSKSSRPELSALQNTQINWYLGRRSWLICLDLLCLWEIFSLSLKLYKTVHVIFYFIRTDCEFESSSDTKAWRLDSRYWSRYWSHSLPSYSTIYTLLYHSLILFI